MSIAVADVWSIRDSASFLDFARDHLDWPYDLPFEEVSYGWELAELGLEATRHLKHIKQLRPMDGSPWGIFFLEFDHHRLPVSDLRQVLRSLVKKQRADARAGDRPRWQLENLLFIATYGRGDEAHTTFAHFKGTQPHNARLSLFHVVNGEPCRTLCEFNLPALKWPGRPAPDAWEHEWSKAFDVEKVTDRFFADFRRLFKSTKQQLKGPRGDEARHDFTQRLFNRLLFVTFIQKKRWLDNDSRYLFNRFELVATSGRNYYDDFLHRLFFWALRAEPEVRDHEEVAAWTVATLGDVPFLNGGLFEEVDDLDAHRGVQIGNDVFAAIFSDLLDHYNLTITESTPLDVEVAVDPEMLGKVFEELVTGRHESGSYYTPKPVVAFMCREALTGHLSQALPDEAEAALAAFVHAHDPQGLRDPEKVLEAVRRVRVCDPACGSGAYLLGMMQELLALRACLFRAQPLDAPRTYDRKLETIQNNLYGVDIDPFAVNIARLRLWLSLAVEYEGRNPPPLPNLDFKIEVGDSLTAPHPDEIGSLFRDRVVREADALARLKAKYLSSHGAEKRDLRHGIECQLAELRESFHDEPAPEGALDWRVAFGEVFPSGGFDIVLANPPYVRADAQFKHILEEGGPGADDSRQNRLERKRQRAIEEWKEYRTTLKGSGLYETLYEKWDLYIPFLERAYHLLRESGQMVFIIADSYNSNKYTEKSHEFFLKQARLERIDFCSDIPLFRAGVNNTIVHFIRTLPASTYEPMRVVRWGASAEEFERNAGLLPTATQAGSGRSLFRIELPHTDTTSTNTVTLQTVCYISVGMVLNAHEKLAPRQFVASDLVSDVRDARHPRPYAEGKDLHRWAVARVRFLEWNTARAPKLLRRPTFPELHAGFPRLMCHRTCGARPVAIMDATGLLSNHTVVVVVPWHRLAGVRNRSIQKTACYRDEDSRKCGLCIVREELGGGINGV